MKKLVILLSILLCAFASYGQIKPYKITNYHLILVWGTDTAGWRIYPCDSLVYWAHLPLRMNFPSISIDEFKTGVGDSNVLFCDGATGRIKSVPIWGGGGSGSGWSLTGNSGTDSINNFIGTTDHTPLYFRVNNERSGFLDSVFYNTMFGVQTAENTGHHNAGFGFNALYNLSTGYYNSALGMGAGQNITSSLNNTAVGFNALSDDKTGSHNTACGAWTLDKTLSGYNTAVGYNSSYWNLTGQENTSVGTSSLYNNRTGSENTAIGSNALNMNVIGSDNIAIGFNAGLYSHGKSYRLYINSIARGDSASDLSKSIIYGVQNSDSSLQELFFNAKVNIGSYNDGYLLPFLDGSANEVLTTDGSGSVSWQPAGGGSSLMDTTGTVIHPNDSSWKMAVGSTVTGGETFKVKGAFAAYGASVTPKTDYNGALCYFNTAKGAFRAGYNTYGYYFDNAQVGTYSAGFNDLSLAQGTSSFAANNGTTAAGSTGYQAAAFNKGNANQNYSFASGVDTRADGYSSFIGGGYETDADSYLSAAFGRYNISGGTAGSWVSTDALFQIGNGTGTFGTGKFNDAFRLNKDASGWITKDSLSKTTWKHITFDNDGDFKYGYRHAVGSADSVVGYSVGATQNIYYKLAPTFTERDTAGIGLVADSVTIQKAGAYKIHCWLQVTTSGQNDKIRVKLYKNGAALPTSAGRWLINSDGSSIQSETKYYMWYVMGLTAGDKLSIRAANLTGSRAIICTDLKLFVEKVPEN